MSIIALFAYVAVSNIAFPSSDFNPTAGRLDDNRYFYSRMYNYSDIAGLPMYRLGLDFIDVMPKYRDEKRPIYFWYKNSDRLANSLQSTYLWQYSRLPDFSNGKRGYPGFSGKNIDILAAKRKSTLVLFDQKESIVVHALRSLKYTNRVKYKITEFKKICRKSICYTIAVLDINKVISNAESKWHGGGAIPLDVSLAWDSPSPGASIEKNDTEISIRTIPKAWNYAIVASLHYPETKHILPVIVRVLLVVKNANAGIGFTGDNVSDFIKRTEIIPGNTPRELYFEFNDLNKLKHFVIQTWDRNKSAKVGILDFSVMQDEAKGLNAPDANGAGVTPHNG